MSETLRAILKIFLIGTMAGMTAFTVVKDAVMSVVSGSRERP